MLAHRLCNRHGTRMNRVFDKIIVIADRSVLDTQPQDTIQRFEDPEGRVAVRVGSRFVSLSGCPLGWVHAAVDHVPANPDPLRGGVELWVTELRRRVAPFGEYGSDNTRYGYPSP